MKPCKGCAQDGQLIVSCLSGRLYVVPYNCCDRTNDWVQRVLGAIAAQEDNDFWADVVNLPLYKFYDKLVTLQKTAIRRWEAFNEQ